MKIKNLTPHTITILNGEKKIELASEGLARVSTTTEVVDIINGIPVNVVKMGEVTGLPAPEKDTILVVSRIVAEAVKGKRNDCLIVDKTVRNADGQIIGCTSLARV